LAQFADVFPEARFVITDRDPYRCTVSLAVLGHAIAEWFCESNPLTDDGRRSKVTGRHVSRQLAGIADFTATAPSRALHISYPELVRAPVEVVHHALAANDDDDDLAAKVTAYLRRQQAGERAAPPDSLDAMGYDRGDVWGDPVIESYCERFGIDPERTRLTGA
jgi:hypothetical protein